ncbi:MAG TPA: alginate lyase family protein, partial [Planctomycetaceae bacterium]|nr:alginate lyase family protein [Planctomycetaceae bacterium]
ADGRWLAGRLNRANIGAARDVWRLVDADYEPIDWQLDFKSGWRWSERTWSKRVRYGHLPGVDVKVPWELARMQHLPWLAWAFALAAGREPGFATRGTYVREFRNQVLDFIATNPPRFGVNWCCTMDVGIRVANWLVAYDLLRAYGAEFDEPFERTFAQSIMAHGRHIIGHLEWSPGLRSNHYLANIAGLLFAAAWLPAGDESDGWLDFAVQELVRETGLQFTDDGANFEASTSYHRLSAEMVVWATAVALAVPEERRCVAFPDAHFDRLETMAGFTIAATRPDGRIVQIGDNDSGRFLKLWPVFSEANGADLHEDGRDHRHVVAAINGLFDRPDFDRFAGSAAVETELVRLLAARGRFHAGGAERAEPQAGRPRRRGDGRPACRPASGGPRAFPHFGLYILENDAVWLAFRCGPVGQNGNGGHAHNDQLSIELCLAGVPFVVDPGTYLYTPLPAERNRFRSTASHNTLVLPGREQNGWQAGRAGLFSLCEATQGRIVRRDEQEIVAEHVGYGPVHRRTLRLTAEGIAGRDACEVRGEKLVVLHFAPEVRVAETADGAGLALQSGGVRAVLRSDAPRWSLTEAAFSPGYGEIVPAVACRLHTRGPSIEWSIQLEDSGL